MIKINYEWYLLASRTESNVLLPLPDKYSDENFFNNREEAITWLTEQREKDNEFGDPWTFVLIEMFHTSNL